MITASLPGASAPSSSSSPSSAPSLSPAVNPASASMPSVDRALVRRAIAFATGALVDGSVAAGSASVHFLKAFGGDPRTGGGGTKNSEKAEGKRDTSRNDAQAGTATPTEARRTAQPAPASLGRKQEDEVTPRTANGGPQNGANARTASAAGAIHEREEAISLATPQRGDGSAPTATTATATESPTKTDQPSWAASVVVAAGSSGGTVASGENSLLSTVIAASTGPVSNSELAVELVTETA